MHHRLLTVMLCRGDELLINIWQLSYPNFYLFFYCISNSGEVNFLKKFFKLTKRPKSFILSATIFHIESLK